MTNETEQVADQEDRSQLDTVDKLDIATLRQYAKLMRIPSQRDWTKEDFIGAIKAKQAESQFSVVFDNSNAPAPGHARILINRDPTPGHRNGPVPVGVNGRFNMIPRGIEIDIPIPFVEALKNSKSGAYRQVGEASRDAPMGVFKEEDVSYYPFQVIAVTPGGTFLNPHDQRSANYERRLAFHKQFGRWPTDGELKEAMRAKIIKEL